MKRLFSSICLTTCLFGTLNLSASPLYSQTVAQAQSRSDLYYTFYGKQIPLALRQDVVAVQFRQTTRTRSSSTLPLHLQLQQDLQGTSDTRSRTRTNTPPVPVDVKPLGEHYALVSVPARTRSTANLNEQIRQQSYVEDTLPVLSLSNTEEENPSAFVLPNEIVVSFEPDLSNSQIQTLLDRYNLKVIRPLRFSPNRYLVRSNAENGVAILNVANRLNGKAGIQSATPNFIQSLSYSVKGQDLDDAALADVPNANAQLQQTLASLPTVEAPFQSSLLPLAWHLNSTPQRGKSLPRTDIRATEAWKQSNGGKGVVVAVLDTLIQWDHPDLAKNLHTVSERPDRLPGEVHGWDFTGNGVTCSTNDPKTCVTGDADTRISEAELATLRPHFQNTFRLSDLELLQEYKQLANQLRRRNGNLSNDRLASAIRNTIRSRIGAEFHGTWVTGAIAAQPQTAQGAIGVAPNAEILPVRVFGLYGEITSARVIEAIGYAADRGAGVINISLGGLLPDQELTDQIFQVLDKSPNVAIVASAGNDSLDGVAFPAAIPGVISVGATNLNGRRTFYSSYGGRLDVVAPGGETTMALKEGILTTGGTWVDGFWQGMQIPSYAWASAVDPQGKYFQVQGTSFSAPIVSGIVALMKGVNPNLKRDRITKILKETASYEGLNLSRSDLNRYRLQSQVGLTMRQDRLSGVFPFPQPVSAEQYFFGNGLVNAEAAVRKARR